MISINREQVVGSSMPGVGCTELQCEAGVICFLSKQGFRVYIERLHASEEYVKGYAYWVGGNDEMYGFGRRRSSRTQLIGHMIQLVNAHRLILQFFIVCVYH